MRPPSFVPMNTAPSTMHAAVHTRYGPPEVVEVREVPRPVPRADEVLVRVQASTVNRTDTGFRSAEYFIGRFWSGLFRPKQTVLGSEYAGVVEAVGSAVTDLRPGDRVFGYDQDRFGAHAEYIVQRAHACIVPMPADRDFPEMAALTDGAVLAMAFLRLGRARTGQHILVNGATGAIGSAAVQLAKAHGLRVTATANTPNLELVRSLGAEHVIDWTTTDFTHLGQRYDQVWDCVGKRTFAQCRPALVPNGVYISSELGPWSQNPFYALFTAKSKGQRVVFPIPSHTRADLEHFRDLLVQGRLRPVIDRTYPLQDIVAAHRYVESGQKTGNVVIDLRS